jgi:hypothetical protein
MPDRERLRRRRLQEKGVITSGPDFSPDITDSYESKRDYFIRFRLTAFEFELISAAAGVDAVALREACQQRDLPGDLVNHLGSPSEWARSIALAAATKRIDEMKQVDILRRVIEAATPKRQGGGKRKK